MLALLNELCALRLKPARPKPCHQRPSRKVWPPFVLVSFAPTSPLPPNPQKYLLGEPIVPHPNHVPCPSHACFAEHLRYLLSVTPRYNLFIAQLVPPFDTQNFAQESHMDDIELVFMGLC
jgi:hypothetical protein